MPADDGVLERIVAVKREDVARRERDVPLAELRKRAGRTARSLRAALTAGGTRFVLEHKRGSPSSGALRAQSDPREVARAYVGAADAISVLTDGPFFAGSFDDLRAVREVAPVPILCKDFVVSPYQVVEARSHGADAVLLMLSVLDDGGALRCLSEARALGMDAVVEVHDGAELDRALALPAEVIGINHRDLRTLVVDLGVSERLAPRVPRDRVVIAESGVSTRRDVDRLAPLVDAFLVGSSLMRAGDVRDAARNLVFGRVKVCGLTTVEDTRVAASTGASLGGLVFTDESPRRVAADAAEAIVREGLLPLVGVFVNADVATVARAARAFALAAVQLHGDEGAAYLQQLRVQLPDGCAIWKVSPMAKDGRSLADEEALDACARVVFDTGTDRLARGPRGRRGGTGRSFEWGALAHHPRLADGVLAGGIGPDNALRARSVGAWALDVSSRVESAPGIKDGTLVRSLFAALRGAGRHGTRPETHALP